VTTSIDHEGIVSAATSTATIGHAGKITGGGEIGKGRNFGFVVQPDKDGDFKGHLEYHDRANDVELDSTSITFVSIQSDDVHAMFTGTARVNHVAGYAFTVTVEDNEEPGRGVDRFHIQFTGPTSYDSNAVAANGGLLTAGHIEVHKADTRGDRDRAVAGVGECESPLAADHWRPGLSLASASATRPLIDWSGAAQISPGEFTNPASQWGRSLTSRRG